MYNNKVNRIMVGNQWFDVRGLLMSFNNEFTGMDEEWFTAHTTNGKSLTGPARALQMIEYTE